MLCIDLANTKVKLCGFRTNEYYRVSTAVTIISDATAVSSSVALEVSIRFHELPLASNDTQFGTLFCSSVQIPDSLHKWNISQSWWKPNDTACQKFAHAQGIECRCDRPGTYALLKIIPIIPQVCMEYFQKCMHNAVSSVSSVGESRNAICHLNDGLSCFTGKKTRRFFKLGGISPGMGSLFQGLNTEVHTG